MYGIQIEEIDIVPKEIPVLYCIVILYCIYCFYPFCFQVYNSVPLTELKVKIFEGQ